MQHLVSKPTLVLQALTCDRCGLTADSPDSEFYEFTSIAYKAGYGSIFGDGNAVEVDLCQKCLQVSLGQWLRVREDDRRAELATWLKTFDPAVHGGEWPSVRRNPEQEG